jgi:protein tyrosine phosphatase (PTP) superfamily phosphohydrolase (DUF442 family)
VSGLWSCRAVELNEPPVVPLGTPQEQCEIGAGSTITATSSTRGAMPVNVWDVAPGVISGGAPHGESQWAYLKARGVRTIISVDGTTPDVETIRRLGMRSVHIPLGYRAIPRDAQLRLARAVRDLPGTVYIHCHHGKHRGPAATASVLVLLGEMTPEEGEAFLKRAGTSPHYPGLFACVRNLSEASEAELDSVPAEFPEVAPTPEVVQAMVQMQEALDHLDAIRDAGWRTPPDHPDLVPAAEAGRLVNLLRGYSERPSDAGREYAELLQESLSAARALEDRVVAGREHSVLTASLALLADSCNACHVRFRGAERGVSP